MEGSELELIKQAQNGDAKSFCVLIEQHSHRVFRLALHFCRNTHDAEDLSQEVWLRVHRFLPTFRFESAFYTWLRQILIRTFLTHRQKTEFVSFDEEIFLSNSFHENANSKILIDQVYETLFELTAQQRLIFLLKYEECMTYEEIGTALDCSSGTVKKTIFRTIQKLREKLDVSLAFKA